MLAFAKPIKAKYTQIHSILIISKIELKILYIWFIGLNVYQGQVHQLSFEPFLLKIRESTY
jgi:hypothetical protein